MSDVPVVHAEIHLNSRVIQEAFEHLCIAMPWHKLKGISEVTVVGVGPHGDSCRHPCFELRRLQTPLLYPLMTREPHILPAPIGKKTQNLIFEGIETG